VYVSVCLSVCLSVCVYARSMNLCTDVDIQVCMHDPCVCTYICAGVLYPGVYPCLCVYADVEIEVFILVYVCMHALVCVNSCADAEIEVHILVYACMRLD
jgi:hypothetical protein